ncbi:hypothetical protein HK100_003183 [Physocladia obscura]|uniref:F-box domain-containing protein n=1 Tax=Physocladia obscura TaxID=109957 RepID=A0AAD5XH14_9FUNG|nr:hypothetical protein HK100_003183 [Physocladia obscura]
MVQVHFPMFIRSAAAQVQQQNFYQVKESRVHPAENIIHKGSGYCNIQSPNPAVLKPQEKKTKALGNELHFNLLPVEIQLKVFKAIFSDHGDSIILTHLSQVCRIWKHLASTSSLVTKIKTQSSGSNASSNVRILAKLSQNFLRHLDLSGGTVISPQAIKEVTLFCPNISHINLSDCDFLTSTDIEFIVDNLEYLTHANLSKLKNLTHIALESLGRHRLLVDVDLSFCARISGHQSMQNIDTILQKCKNLHVLKLNGLDFDANTLENKNGEDNPCFLRIPSTLTWLEISNPLRLPESAFMSTFSIGNHTCMSLAHLNFSKSATAITDTFLKTLAFCVPNLRVLDISLCPRITDNGVQALIQELCSLCNLNLDGNSGVSDALIQWLEARIIGGASRELRMLSLRGCSRISTTAVDAFLAKVEGRRMRRRTSAEKIAGKVLLLACKGKIGQSSCPGGLIVKTGMTVDPDNVSEDDEMVDSGCMIM